MNTRFDSYRETTPGRANVGDSPDLLAYYGRLSELGAGALWTVANKIEPWQPVPHSAPMIWRYLDLREAVLRALKLVSPEEAGRRVIYLANPNRQDVAAAVGWLYSGLQVMAPGECASSHRHSASALRFIMEGSGAFTNVDGHKMTLGRNDFVLTPNGTWHEHGVAENGTNCIWQDGLDIPLVNALEAGFYEVHPDLRQAISYPIDESSSMWGSPGLRPAGADWQRRYSPLLKYEWEPTYEALCRYAAVYDGSPFDAIHMDYVNPATGGPVMTTMGASIQMLRPGERTRAHREVGNFVYQCAKGSGWSIINGQRYDWSERDIFVVPSWTYHEHGNSSQTEDTCLFSFHDLPAMRALGLYRQEALGENGGHQPIT
ncbi:cupin domain-containing protein [Flavisphingomonas formosensis]|uniref:cupin domain-containing protein n=1 Tax=Flavisphingomonas formosensis TaxID=861534 RepID=UPI0012FC2760|nr:cupin domain-containing protein [Sphingomonas formosensis]